MIIKKFKYIVMSWISSPKNSKVHQDLKTMNLYENKVLPDVIKVWIKWRLHWIMMDLKSKENILMGYWEEHI